MVKMKQIYFLVSCVQCTAFQALTIDNLSCIIKSNLTFIGPNLRHKISKAMQKQVDKSGNLNSILSNI